MGTEAQIFVFTASSRAATENAEKTLRRRVNPELVSRHFPDLGGQAIYAWGVAPGPHNLTKWRAMRGGDWVFGVTHKTYFCVAQIIRTAHSPELARSLWGKLEDGRTWEYMYFLHQPREVRVPVSEVEDLLHRKYHGLTHIGADKLARIRTQFGSLEEFMAARLPEDSGYGCRITREDVLHAISEYDESLLPGFGARAQYQLSYSGRTYPPKALYALAYRRVFGVTLAPSQIPSGENSALFHTLRVLGFQIGRSDERPPLTNR